MRLRQGPSVASSSWQGSTGYLKSAGNASVPVAQDNPQEDHHQDHKDNYTTIKNHDKRSRGAALPGSRWSPPNDVRYSLMLDEDPPPTVYYRPVRRHHY